MASQKLVPLLLFYLAFGAAALRLDYGKLGYRADLATTTMSSNSPQFTVPGDADNGATRLPTVNDPQAIDAQSVCPGYVASNVQNTTNGFTADLDLAGASCNAYGNEINSLALIVEYQAKDRLHVEILPRYIGPENSSWFILPEALVPRPTVEDRSGCGAGSNELKFDWSNDPSFSFTVTRKSTKDVLFTTKGSKLVFEDQFFEFVTQQPENYNLYGLGEVIHGFRLGNNLTRTLFAADAGDPIDGNIYGTHPIYLDTRYFDCSGNYVANATDTSAKYTSQTHGVFLRNAHAQEIVLRESNITWRGLGGTIDLYFYAGPSVESVLTSYQMSATGLPAMQQYFAFGYHQCRWGYTGWDDLQEIVNSFAEFQIPLETIWSDIDYMNQYRDFENDQNSWGYDKGAKFLAGLHANGQHFVPIVDSAIYVPNPSNASDAYPTYDRGVQADAFILNPDGSLYIGDVWPGYTVFPDWIGAVLNGTRTFDWWTNEMTTWHQKVAYSGIWIDMSEVSSFCVGSCGTGNLTLNPVHPPFKLPGEPGAEIFQYPEGFNLTNGTDAASVSALSSSLAAATAKPTSSVSSVAASTSSSSTSYLRTTPTPGARNINYPPYVIDNVQGDLAVHAVSPNGTHHGGFLEYDFHNLFGHQILNATYHALLNVFPGKRPFIIGRSTFAGSGKWAGHWGGDNASLWSLMYFSISQALSFSIFGIPMFGVDTCGFNGNTDMELCARWMQLSAFFPFYRNHNVLSAIPQEPFRWSAVADATKTAMAIRYSLLPYMYTAFWKASTQGQTVMRALAWEFPSEPWLANADRQFLLGDAVLVTPCLVQGADSVDGVFPGVGDGTTWYDWYTNSPVKDVSAGQNVTIPAPLGHIPVYLRGGHIIPTQQPGMTTKASRQNPWGLIVALDAQGKARGELYVDDGESLMPSETLKVKFSASSSKLSVSVHGKYADAIPLGDLRILGLSKSVSTLKLNGSAVDSGSWSYNATSQAVIATNLQALTKSGAWSGAWELSWD